MTRLDRRGFIFGCAFAAAVAAIVAPAEARLRISPELQTKKLYFSPAPISNTAPQGTAVGNIRVPAGYVAVLEDTCDGCFQLVNNQIQVGATTLYDGWYQPTIGIYRPGQRLTRQSIHPLIEVLPVYAPSDLPGLLHGWRSDEGVTVSGTDVTSVAAAWGTTGDLTGAFASGGTSVKPQQLVGGGPNGKNAITFTTAARNRLTGVGVTGLTVGTVYIAYKQDITSSQQAVIGHTNNNNYISQTGTANAWTSSAIIKLNGGSEISSSYSATLGQFDHRGVQILTVVFDGVNQTVYVNGVKGNSTAQTGTINFSQFGGNNTGLNFGGMWIASTIHNLAHSDADVLNGVRALNQFRQRNFYFAANGNDTNTGWSPSAAKLIPATFGAAYKSAPGTRYLMQVGDRFSQTASMGFTQNNCFAGMRGRVGAYSAGTGKPPITGVILPATFGNAIPTLFKTTLAGSVNYTSGWTDNLDGTWSRAPGFTPEGVWRMLPTGRAGTVLVSQATSNDNSWAFSAGTLTIRLQSGQDANTSSIEVGRGIESFNTSNVYIEAADFIALGCGGTGAVRHRGSNGVMKQLGIQNASADSYNLAGNSTTDHDLIGYDLGNGVPATLGNLPSTNYDGHTSHGGDRKSYGLLLENVYWHGIANLSAVLCEFYDCIVSARIPFYILPDGGSGNLTITRGYVVQYADSGVINSVTLSSGATPTCSVVDSFFVQSGSLKVGSKAISVGSGVAAPTNTNSIQSNYASFT